MLTMTMYPGDLLLLHTSEGLVTIDLKVKTQSKGKVSVAVDAPNCIDVSRQYEKSGRTFRTTREGKEEVAA